MGPLCCWEEEKSKLDFLQDSQQFSVSAASPGCAYPTRRPPGHPCALLLLLELPTPSRGIMRPLMSWPCPLKSWQRDWRQRSPHFLSILCLQALLGVAFLLSPSEISRLLVGQESLCMSHEQRKILSRTGNALFQWQHQVAKGLQLSRHQSGREMPVSLSSRHFMNLYELFSWLSSLHPHPPTKLFLC